MPFTETELAEHLATLETHFWAQRRPPLHLRDKIREGQRIEGTDIELFFVRPAFQRPGEWTEESVAKISFVRSRKLWRLYWKRADMKWHRYPPCPECTTLAEALRQIQSDKHGCFFG